MNNLHRKKTVMDNHRGSGRRGTESVACVNSGPPKRKFRKPARRHDESAPSK